MLFTHFFFATWLLTLEAKHPLLSHQLKNGAQGWPHALNFLQLLSMQIGENADVLSLQERNLLF